MGQEKLKFYAIAFLLFITLAFCRFFTNGTSPSRLLISWTFRIQERLKYFNTPHMIMSMMAPRFC